MYKDTRNYFKTCNEYQRRGKNKKIEPLHPIKIGQPFVYLGMDIVEPLLKTKNRNMYIVIVTEYLTKLPEVSTTPFSYLIFL